MAAWTTTPRTWTAAEVLTAANMNAQLKDFQGAFGAWASYTPTVAQGVSTNISKTVDYAKYSQAQKTVHAVVKCSMTGTGTAGSYVSVSLPVASPLANLIVGSGLYYDTGTDTKIAAVYLATTALAILIRSDAPITGGYGIGIDPNIAVASGDILELAFTYEAA